ncbi:MAG: adenylyltransferase/cytidyltransferase family protein, partial [Alphaproteobacteria bacterium]|nr:adenylyltransferase/cytidyltransferase family protein [Alphaproteobacteria bacterium]
TPSKIKNTIHIFGPCGTYCPAVTDTYTLESYLQRLINNAMPDSLISVDNCGVPGTDTLNDFEYMINEKYHPGDIVIDFSLIFNRQDLLKKAINKHGFDYLIPRDLFNKPHNYGYVIVDGGGHKNHRANEVFSKYFYSLIKQDLNKMQSETPYIKYNSDYDKDIFLSNNPDLKKYLSFLKKYKDNNLNKKIGAIVMNCNPFTLGHRYLIEKASSMVDKLYIFVVEEDKSIFPFKDRLELVKLGTEDLKNVTVLPSGKYMISLLTLPGYFSKDSKTVDTIDASKDLNLFAQYIAPALGINVRFAGTEPLDKFTCEYNKSMKKELPKFNIEFCEIDRKAIDGNIISASKVRQLLSEQKFEELEKYVPKTTYNYLMKNSINNR